MMTMRSPGAQRARQGAVYTTHSGRAERLAIASSSSTRQGDCTRHAGRAVPAAAGRADADLDIEARSTPMRCAASPASSRCSSIRAGSPSVDDITLGAQAVCTQWPSAGATVRHLSSGRANLEDVFLALTGINCAIDAPPTQQGIP